MAKLKLSLALSATRRLDITVVCRVKGQTGKEAEVIRKTITVDTTPKKYDLEGTFDHKDLFGTAEGSVIVTLQIYYNNKLIFDQRYTLGAKITTKQVKYDASTLEFSVDAYLESLSDVTTKIYCGCSLVAYGKSYDLAPLEVTLAPYQKTSITFSEKRGGGKPKLDEAYEVLGTTDVKVVTAAWAYYDEVEDRMYGRYHRHEMSWKIPEDLVKPTITVTIERIYIE